MRAQYRTGNGFAYFTELNRTGRRLNLQLSGAGYTRDYRADLGFTTRTDTIVWSVVPLRRAEKNDVSTKFTKRREEFLPL